MRRSSNRFASAGRFTYGENEPGNPATAVRSIRDGYVGQVIVLDRDMWTSAKSMDAFVRDQSERGKHIQAKHADSINTHEYGHVLHNSCALKRVGYTGQGTISEQQIARFALEKKKIVDEVQLILENDDLRFDRNGRMTKLRNLLPRLCPITTAEIGRRHRSLLPII